MSTKVLLGAVLLVSACTLSPDIAATSSTSDTTTTVPTVTTTTTSGGATTTSLLPEAPVQMVEAAIDDLASRLGVEPRTIRLISSETVTWPDGSLGCPEPERSYTQAQVGGYRVVLNHAERAYDYHAGPDGSPFLCPTAERDGGYDFIPPPGFDT